MNSDAARWGGSDSDEQRREEFFDLLDQNTKRGSYEARQRVHGAVQTLAEQALRDTRLLGTEVKRSIEKVIADIDRKLNEQLEPILHSTDFQELEASWRGLWFMCSHPVESLRPKVQVLDVGKAELVRASRSPDFTQSVLVRRVHTEPLCTPGGTPYTAVLADYDITDDPVDVSLIQYLGRVGRLANTPFVLAASPALLGLTSFQEMEDAAGTALTLGSAISSFRQHDEARFVSLAMPRILLRKPYAIRPDGQPWFQMEEQISDRDSYLWGRPIWALGNAIIAAGVRTGWFADITRDEDCKVISGLPRHQARLRDDLTLSLVGPVEHVLSYRREREMVALGLTPVSQADSDRDAVLNWACTLYEGKTIDRTGIRKHGATAESDLRAVLCACQFAHTASKIWHDLRPLRGPAEDASATSSREQALARWIRAHSVSDAGTPSPLRPLAGGTVVVEATPRLPTPWLAMLELWPAYGFDEPGPVRLQVQLEVRYPETRASRAAVRIAAAGEAADLPAFSLQRADVCERADEVLHACTSRLAEARCPPYRIVLGPLTVHATVYARRSLDELVDAVLAYDGGLEVEIAAHLVDAPIDASRVGLLAHYPSGIVRGLSATLDSDGESYVLRLLDPVALLDPGALGPVSRGSLIACTFDILAVEAAATL